ncbi:hypothetical protein GCM10020001_046350 [Nonomuraea salmonea]
MQDLTIRPITGLEELDLFNRHPYTLNHELADDLAAGRRHPSWMWMALRGDRLLARLAWWGRDKDDDPFLLDILDLEEGAVDVAVRLLRTAMAETLPAGGRPPEYLRFVPPDWRETDRRAVEDRMAVLESTGARLFVERLRLEWRPGTPIHEPSGRLSFRPVRDENELLDLMTEVLDGTLDAHSRDDLTHMSPPRGRRQALRGRDRPLHQPPRVVAGRDAARRRTGRFRHPRPQRLQRDHRLHRRPARTSRQRLHRRPPRRGHPHPRRGARPPHPRRHRPRQHPDGAGVRKGRLRQLRTLDQHDLARLGIGEVGRPGRPAACR